MAQTLSQQQEMAAFIALWDEAVGPMLVDEFQINGTMSDLDMLAVNIFMTFQTVFGDSSDVSFKRTSLVMPFKSREQISKILLDVVPNPQVRGGNQPYIIVFLLPDWIPEEKIAIFDPIMEKVSALYSAKKGAVFSSFREEIESAFKISLQMDDMVIVLDESYALTTAVGDFKKGIELFQQKSWASALSLLRKAEAKFEAESQHQLRMEANFLIASILSQQKKFQTARVFYEKLGSLAKDLNHLKYQQTSQFMQGFCAYKIGQFTHAIALFDQIDIENAQFINKLQFYSLRGLMFKKLEVNGRALENLEKAFEISQSLPENDALQRQKAQILFDWGMVIYKEGISNLKSKGFQNQDAISEYMASLKIAIEKFTAAINVWENLRDLPNMIYSYRLIANIYGLLQNSDKQIDAYEKALNNAEQTNDFSQKLKIVHEIYNINSKLGNHEANIALMHLALENMESNAFIDAVSQARVHFSLGESYGQMNQMDNAILEYITALNIFKRLSQPVPEEVITLDRLLSIYSVQQNQEKIDYYQAQLDQIKQKLSTSIHPTKISLGVLKDIWFFTTSGIEIISIAPEMQFDPILLGGFLSAMQNFSVEISTKQMNAFLIGEDRYSFYFEADKPFYILGRNSIKYPEMQVNDTLQLIYRRFYQEYESHLLNFTGNVKAFQTFPQILREMKLHPQ